MSILNNESLPRFLRNENPIAKMFRFLNRPPKVVVDLETKLIKLIQDELTVLKSEQEEELANLRNDITKKFDKLRDQIAIAFLESDHKPVWTTNVADILECGFGECDGNGFFDFVVPKHVMDHKKEYEKLKKILTIE